MLGAQQSFGDAVQAGEVYPNGEPLADLIRHHAAHYGSLIRCRYGEPFYTSERGMSQRLPNGNTLIVNSERGTLLEVTPEKEIAWSC